MNNGRKRIIGLVVASFVVLSFVVLIIAHLQSQSAKISLTVSPTESHITINGKGVKAGDSRVQPGTYKVVVALSGFSTANQTVTVKKNQTATVELTLTSDSAKTANWYNTHPKDEQVAESISGYNTSVLAHQAVKNVPLIKELPFIGAGFEFRIDYGSQPGASASNPTIYITAETTQAQQDAVLWIKSQGYNPAKLNIVYQIGSPLNQ